ncbi:MAG: alpha/beta fold hydrolase [Chloroflexota bacterium]
MRLFNPMPLWREWNQYGRRTDRRSLRWLELQQKPPQMADLQLAPTPAEVVYRLNKIRLLHYGNGQSGRPGTPLLLVPSIINRYYVLDLQPGRSLVAYLLERGLDVWLVDWGRPTAEDRFDTLDDYILLYLRRLINRVRRETGSQQVSILGYCIGGLFSAIYTALFPDEIANLINLAGPIRFADDGLFCAWTRPDRFSSDTLVDALGNVPGRLMNFSFDAMLPGNPVRQALSLWERLDDETKLRDYLGLQFWLKDETDFPGETYRRYIRDCYQQDLLIKGQLVIGGRRVNLADVTCPVLSITATQDHIAPPPSVVALNQAVSSDDETVLSIAGGHIGIVTGRSARQELWPKLAGWLLERTAHRE